jgi:phosphoribosylanthranilate isomerase
MTWVKICGTTTLRDAQIALQAGADALGFVFAPGPRRVTSEQVRDIVVHLPPGPDRVGVFVNESQGRIVEIVRDCGLTAVQLHGDETAEFARTLRVKLPDAKIFKALPYAAAVNDASNLQRLSGDSLYDAWLLDGAWAGARGGSGISFDWSQAKAMLSAIAFRENLIVAGGLNSENVTQPLSVLRPWGVDVVSGVEAGPGRKDPGKVRAFVQAVRGWENGLSNGNH